MSSRQDKTVPIEHAPGREPEPFLARWSRRKDESRRDAEDKAPQPPAQSEAAPPELPPIEKLTLDSDFRGFMHPEVSEDQRRAALKKLFSEPHLVTNPTKPKTKAKNSDNAPMPTPARPRGSGRKSIHFRQSGR